MRAAEFVSEKWSAKYKRSINCSNPRGFSQRAHCQGRRKNEDIDEHIVKHANESQEFQWSDYESVKDMSQRIAIAEAHFDTNGNLFESNDPERSEYFLSLTSMSSEPAKNKPFILVMLGLVNNKLVQLQFPEIVKILRKNNNSYTVERRDGTTATFPDKSLSNKLTAATFFFDNTDAYDKFRSVILLKFDQPLVDADEITGSKEQLDELSFLGSQCTKDCSGHRAGYEWSTRKGGADAASWSPSFNKGAWLHNNGF